MRLPLFVGATPAKGLRSSAVMIPSGTWTVVCDDARLQVHVSGESVDPTFQTTGLSHVQVTVEEFSCTSLTAFIERINEPQLTESEG